MQVGNASLEVRTDAVQEDLEGQFALKCVTYITRLNELFYTYKRVISHVKNDAGNEKLVNVCHTMMVALDDKTMRPIKGGVAPLVVCPPSLSLDSEVPSLTFTLLFPYVCHSFRRLSLTPKTVSVTRSEDCLSHLILKRCT